VDRRFEWRAAIALAVALLSFVLLSAALSRGKTIAFDEACRTGLHSIANPALTLLMLAVTALGSQAVLLVVAGGAVIWMFLSGSHRDAWLIVIGMAGAELLMPILKVEFHRQRPEPFFDVIAPNSYSFPSGHALLSFCCYGLLAMVAGSHLRGRRRQLVRIGAVVLILAIGISRVYLGVHHATDVIAGYLVGTIWLAALLAIARV
jgi:undecaprenyl-diphosphatase